MENIPRYEVIVSYDEDQKLSVWWRLHSNVKNAVSFFLRLKEGKDKPEQTNERESFGHDSTNELHQMDLLMILRSDYNFKSSDMLAEAKQMIANERAKTVSYFDFLALRKEFDALREQVKSKLRIKD